MTSFLDYFQQYYCTRIDQWVTFARVFTVANTNMHVEAFYRLIKVVHFQGKQNGQIDH